MSDFLKSPSPRVAAPVDQAQLLDKAVTLFALALVVTALYVGRAVFIPIAIGLMIFGWYAFKGEYDRLPESSKEL